MSTSRKKKQKSSNETKKITLPRKVFTFYGDDDPVGPEDKRTEYRFSCDQLGNVEFFHWKKGQHSLTSRVSTYELRNLKAWIDRVVAYIER